MNSTLQIDTNYMTDNEDEILSPLKLKRTIEDLCNSPNFDEIRDRLSESVFKSEENKSCPSQNFIEPLVQDLLSFLEEIPRAVKRKFGKKSKSADSNDDLNHKHLQKSNFRATLEKKRQIIRVIKAEIGNLCSTVHPNDFSIIKEGINISDFVYQRVYELISIMDTSTSSIIKFQSIFSPKFLLLVSDFDAYLDIPIQLSDPINLLNFMYYLEFILQNRFDDPSSKLTFPFLTSSINCNQKSVDNKLKDVNASFETLKCCQKENDMEYSNFLDDIVHLEDGAVEKPGSNGKNKKINRLYFQYNSHENIKIISEYEAEFSYRIILCFDSGKSIQIERASQKMKLKISNEYPFQIVSTHIFYGSDGFNCNQN